MLREIPGNQYSPGHDMAVEKFAQGVDLDGGSIPAGEPFHHLKQRVVDDGLDLQSRVADDISEGQEASSQVEVFAMAQEAIVVSGPQDRAFPNQRAKG